MRYLVKRLPPPPPSPNRVNRSNRSNLYISKTRPQQGENFLPPTDVVLITRVFFFVISFSVFLILSHSDNENYKKSWNKVQRMIKDKKKNFVIGKLIDNIGKQKELWKSLKSVGLPSKESSSATICIEKDGILSFDPETNAEIFKDFYSNLGNILVKSSQPPK